MKKSLLFSLLTYLLFFSCSNIYYVGLNSEPLQIFSNSNINSQIFYTIPVASKVLTRKKSKNYDYVIYQSYNGTLYKGYVLSQTTLIITSLIQQLMANYMDIHLRRRNIQINHLEIVRERFM